MNSGWTGDSHGETSTSTNEERDTTEHPYRIGSCAHSRVTRGIISHCRDRCCCSIPNGRSRACEAGVYAACISPSAHEDGHLFMQISPPVRNWHSPMRHPADRSDWMGPCAPAIKSYFASHSRDGHVVLPALIGGRGKK